jgi:nucleoside-diphosphate-sugar epimerase
MKGALAFLMLGCVVQGQQPLSEDGPGDLETIEIESGATVCVTGASGYVASVLIKQLLDDGYKVVGTVRDVEKYNSEAVFKDVELFKADLLDGASFDKPFTKCSALIHTASPFWSSTGGADPEELFVKPAKDGTLNVLKAANKAGIKVVVVTSSTAAVTPQHNNLEKYHDTRMVKAGLFPSFSREFNEDDWNMDSTLEEGPYRLSKRLAEQAAWEYTKKNGMRMAVINPAFILGPPVLTRATGESMLFMAKMLRGNFSLAGAPKMNFGITDVRDLAKAHIAAMKLKGAKGKRFVLSSRVAHSALEISEMLVQYFDLKGGDELNFLIPRLPKIEMGDDLLAEEPPPSYKNTYDHTRAVTHLGFDQTHTIQTVGDMAQQFFDLGIVQLLHEKDDELSGLHISDEL